MNGNLRRKRQESGDKRLMAKAKDKRRIFIALVARRTRTGKHIWANARAAQYPVMAVQGVSPSPAGKNVIETTIAWAKTCAVFADSSLFDQRLPRKQPISIPSSSGAVARLPIDIDSIVDSVNLLVGDQPLLLQIDNA